MSWPLEEHARGAEPLSTQNQSHSLTELHDAYRTFCEYGWHHVTWKNLAVSLLTYLSTHFAQDDDGQLQHFQPNAARAEYLARLSVEAFGYLTKDALWVLLTRTGYTGHGEAGLGYHRPFHTPAWQYLSSLPDLDLQVLTVDIAKVLRERTTSPHAQGNILSLASSWRPTFGSEYGVFQYLDVDLSPKDAAIWAQIQLEESTDTAITPSGRSKSFLKRALSMRNVHKSRASSSESSGESSVQQRKRFSWPLTEKYRRLFKPQSRSRNAETTAEWDQTTIKPKSSPAVESAISSSETLNGALSNSSSTIIPATGGLGIIQDVIEEEDISDNQSIKSSHTLDSLLHFYAQNIRYPTPQPSELDKSPIAIPELPRPDSPILAPSLPYTTISRNPSLRVTLADQRPMSTSSGHQSFVTANTDASSRSNSRLTRQSSRESFLSFETIISHDRDAPASSGYYKLLEEHDLIPQPALANDWSGRGQHAEFTPAERSNVPLQAEKLLGSTRTALVESVRCRRIRLVRKTIKCTKWTGVKREDALREVQHLYRARHAHIVRLVGTYVIGPDLAILTYPCAEWNLEQFMAFARTSHAAGAKCTSSLRQFFTCTAKTLDFLHSFPIKHMDIKPQNLLVRDISTSNTGDSNRYKIYFTDFGISRSYESVEDCDTESPTSFTRMYAAREVIMQECRGLSADMFSLGCVYAEMLATILDASLTQLREDPTKANWAALNTARQNTERVMRPYHLVTAEVRAWLSSLSVKEEPELLAVRDWTLVLLSTESSTRPTARQIAEDPHLPFACLNCNLQRGPEDFEVAEPLALTPRQESPHFWETPARTIIEVPMLA